MKKQGFTLIELMVVIVIMGILAAVAVPKLFGMIAKSKASEVGPAAGTYVKLQQAYFSESMKAGGWTLIGYSAPGNNGLTTNFAYGMGSAINSNSAETLTAGTKTMVWTATNLANLNECTGTSGAAGMNKDQTGPWKVSVTQPTGNANQDLTFDAEIVGNTAAGCTALTPSFNKIGK